MAGILSSQPTVHELEGMRDLAGILSENEINGRILPTLSE
jgi:hypothetical protein